MPIDPYAACPGGTGKKIKFCCADLVGDLEQLDRLIEGEQISAALEQVERLAESHPKRACLMATRTKLEFASRKLAEASVSSRAFLEAYPDNPLALGHAAVAEAIAGRLQEAAVLFDKAREAAGKEPSQELVRVAATIVQASAQAGHPGCAQGIVEWLSDASLGSAEDRRLLASVVGSSGVAPSLRTKVHFAECPAESPVRFEFEAGLKHARGWHLAKALTTFRSLKGVAAESPELFTNIAVLCEMLARPFEAAEAWLTVARLKAGSPDDSIEATGRAIALETEADEDRSPVIPFVRASAPLAAAAEQAASGASGVGIDLLEDRLRHDGRFESAPFERSEWVSRGAAPPRSVWRVYEAVGGDGAAPSRLLASLLIFGRQTDSEPEAVLQGFAPDVDSARGVVESILGVGFIPTTEATQLPVVSPTNWLLSTQFRLTPPPLPTAGTPPGAPTVLDTLLAQQRGAMWERFLDRWPATPLPELLGKTPREALQQADGARRVEALIGEGEATSRRRDAADAWATMRGRLSVKTPPAIVSAKPLGEVPPMRWHRVDMGGLELDQLRGLFLTALDAGFDSAAERAAEAILARSDTAPEDRWEALSLLEDRALSSERKLEIIVELRTLAKLLKASDGMIDVAELRVRLQRGDQAEIMRLLDHLRRDHARDQKVLEAVAEVLMEAGIDLPGMAARGGGQPLGSTPAGPPAQAQPASGGIWTPGSPQPGAPAEKKTIWTPG